MKITNAILIDFHGTLTTGQMSISHTGEYHFDHVHTRDIRAIRELAASGYYVAIVTSSSSPIIQSFADKVGVELIVSRDKGEVAPRFENYIAIGDDAWDVPLLSRAARGFCPSDADYSVRIIPGVQTLLTRGGRGVMAEIVHILAEGKMTV